MKTSDREKRKLAAEWRCIASEWRMQGKGLKPLIPDQKTGEQFTRPERLLMAKVMVDCANELEAML